MQWYDEVNSTILDLEHLCQFFNVFLTTYRKKISFTIAFTYKKQA